MKNEFVHVNCSYSFSTINCPPLMTTSYHLFCCFVDTLKKNGKKYIAIMDNTKDNIATPITPPRFEDKITFSSNVRKIVLNIIIKQHSVKNKDNFFHLEWKTVIWKRRLSNL